MVFICKDFVIVNHQPTHRTERRIKLHLGLTFAKRKASPEMVLYKFLVTVRKTFKYNGF